MFDLDKFVDLAFTFDLTFIDFVVSRLEEDLWANSFFSNP